MITAKVRRVWSDNLFYVMFHISDIENIRLHLHRAVFGAVQVPVRIWDELEEWITIAPQVDKCSLP